VDRAAWHGRAGGKRNAADLAGSRPCVRTGAHPTTQLCLRVLDRRLAPGARVLDLGTGTGILAIAAARLGAQEVVGVEIDPDAVEVARANVSYNGVSERVRVETGTLAGLIARREMPFSWVMANILAHILVGFFDQGLREQLEPGRLARPVWLPAEPDAAPARRLDGR